MKKIQLLSIAVVAFALGFLVSEYRHLNTAVPLVQQVSVTAASSSVAAPSVSSRTRVIAPPVAVPPTSQSAPLPAATPQSPMEQARALVANNQYPQAVQVLVAFLQQEPGNLEATLLLARVYEKQGLHKESVALWFRYLNGERDAQKIDAALDYLSQYLLRLARNTGLFGEERTWLMAQLDNLIKLTPDSGELHLQLANMHADNKDTEQAQYHGLMAANQQETRQRAEVFLATLTEQNISAQTSGEELLVELERYGSQFLVPVFVEGLPAKLLLDTGASLSGLTDAFVLAHYSLVKSPKPIQLNTASGSVNSILFTVNNFSLAGIQFEKHMLTQLPMNTQGRFDGLLGVDILGRFEFSLDQEKAQLRLRKRK